MNRIYKVVFSRTLGAYRAVSELASFKGKKKPGAAFILAASLMVAGPVSAGTLAGGLDGTPKDPADTVSYTGAASGNYVSSNGSIVSDGYDAKDKSLYGGYAYLSSGSEALNASADSVSVKNASDIGSKSITGAAVYAEAGTAVTSVNATGNTVTLDSDTAANNAALTGADVTVSGKVSGATVLGNNAVNIEGTAAGSSLGTLHAANATITEAASGITLSENSLSATGTSAGYARAANLVLSETTENAAVDITAYKNTLVFTGVSANVANAADIETAAGATVNNVTASQNAVILTNTTTDGNNVHAADVDLFGKVTGNIESNGNSVTVSSAEGRSDTVKFIAVAPVSVYSTVEGSVTSSGNTADVTNIDSQGVYAGYVNTTDTSDVKGAITIAGNQAKVAGGSVDGVVYAATLIAEGKTASAEIKDNTATVSGATVTKYIQGAEITANNVSAFGNRSVVSDSTARYVSGAYAQGDSVTMTGNDATVTDSKVTGASDAPIFRELGIVDGVIGAEVVGNNAVLSGNTVSVIRSDVTDANIQGAEVLGDGAKLTGNRANATGVTSAKKVSGAYTVGDNSVVTGNTANIAGSNISWCIEGGKAKGVNVVVSGNTANVSAGTTIAHLAGGVSVGAGGQITGNTVNVSGSTVNSEAHGARSYGNGIFSSGNTVNMSGSLAYNVAGAYINGQNGELSGNMVNVTGTTVTNTSTGAQAIGNHATLAGNTLNLSDTAAYSADGANVKGDYATLSGNTAGVGGNSVIEESVRGAFAQGDHNVLTKNTLNLSGNTAFVDGSAVYAAAGYSDTDDATNTVKDNTVNVSGNVKLSNVDMYGRRAGNQGSGNTLNLNRWKGEIKSVNYFDSVNINTSSASKEQVVIGDLTKGNADTKITVNMDSQAARELNPADGTIAGGVREASKIVKLEKVDGSSEHDETIRVNMEEGDLVGNISADVTESGRITGLVEKENSIISSLRMIGANNFLVFRQQMNDLEKRMGDLRTMSQSDGSWARVVAGQAEYKGLHSTYKTVQAGADKRIGQFVIGATASYTDADGTMKRLGTDDKNYTYGIYGSWLGDNGHFVDVILKRHHVASEFDARYADGRKVDGSTHTSGTSLSVEYGKRFGITNTNFYVEPQVELMWGKLESDSYKLSNGVKVSQDSTDSFIGRLGVAAGWLSPEKKGSAYIKASVLNDWEADAEMKAKKGAVVKKFHEDMGGTWGEFVIGGTYNFSKNFSAYGEIETSAGNPTKTTYQASAGVRYSF